MIDGAEYDRDTGKDFRTVRQREIQCRGEAGDDQVHLPLLVLASQVFNLDLPVVIAARVRDIEVLGVYFDTLGGTGCEGCAKALIGHCMSGTSVVVLREEQDDQL